MIIKRLAETFKEEFVDQTEAELISQAEQRLLLVIKARWFLIALLFFYGSASTISYLAGNYPLAEIIQLNTWPTIILLGVVAYNAFYHIAWHHYPWMWVSRIKHFIRIQLVLDAIIVTVLIHFTGGIASWFWALYLLLTLEFTYLIPSQWEVIFMGFLAVSIYSALIFSEFLNIIKPVRMPFMVANLNNNVAYVLIVWLWVCFINGCAAVVTSYLHGKEKGEIKQKVIKDGLTNLYNRRFFNHSINSEIERAKRFKRTVSLLMIDLDNFKKYNDTFGHPQGDDLLRLVSKILGENLRRSVQEPTYDVDIACRYGGEEFAIILPETGVISSLKKAEQIKNEVQSSGALILAEKLRTQIEKTKMLGKGVTISIGVATYPTHAKDSQELIEVADKALYQAKALGKNKVSQADQIIKPDKIPTN